MTEIRKPGWMFYGGWMLLSVVALPVGFALALAIGTPVSQVLGDRIRAGGASAVTEDFLMGYFLFGGIGLVMGVLQGALLRRLSVRWGWWTIATVVGAMLPFIAGPLLVTGRTVGPLWDIDRVRGALTLSLVGITLGVAQWVVLRDKVRGAGWWIPITVAGWALAGFTGGVELSTPLDALAIVLLPPAATTLALWLLLDILPGAGSLARATRTSVHDLA